MKKVISALMMTAVAAESSCGDPDCVANPDTCRSDLANFLYGFGLITPLLAGGVTEIMGAMFNPTTPLGGWYAAGNDACLTCAGTASGLMGGGAPEVDPADPMATTRAMVGCAGVEATYGTPHACTTSAFTWFTGDFAAAVAAGPQDGMDEATFGFMQMGEMAVGFETAQCYGCVLELFKTPASMEDSTHLNNCFDMAAIAQAQAAAAEAAANAAAEEAGSEATETGEEASDDTPADSQNPAPAPANNDNDDDEDSAFGMGVGLAAASALMAVVV